MRRPESEATNETLMIYTKMNEKSMCGNLRGLEIKLIYFSFEILIKVYAISSAVNGG